MIGPALFVSIFTIEGWLRPGYSACSMFVSELSLGPRGWARGGREMALRMDSLDGAAVEVFLWSERHAETRTARALRRPGYELQRVLGTREPTERQLEVGRAALAEILRAEGVPLDPASAP